MSDQRTCLTVDCMMLLTVELREILVRVMAGFGTKVDHNSVCKFQR